MADSDCRPKKISCVSRVDRTSLLQACNSMRDRLLVRMELEVGLRTEENKGLVINDFRAKIALISDDWEGDLLHRPVESTAQSCH